MPICASAHARHVATATAEAAYPRANHYRIDRRLSFSAQTEHRLQYDDQQTQNLPDDPVDQALIAAAMVIPASPIFCSSSISTAIVAALRTHFAAPRKSRDDILTSLWQEHAATVPVAAATNQLTTLGFTEPAKFQPESAILWQLFFQQLPPPASADQIMMPILVDRPVSAGRIDVGAHAAIARAYSQHTATGFIGSTADPAADHRWSAPASGHRLPRPPPHPARSTATPRGIPAARLARTQAGAHANSPTPTAPRATSRMANDVYATSSMHRCFSCWRSTEGGCCWKR